MADEARANGQRQTVAVAPREFGSSLAAALLRKLDRFAP